MRDVFINFRYIEFIKTVSRISLVKPNLGRELEDALINQARLGQLRGSSINGQVSEKDLTNLLEKISSQELAKREASKVQFQRRGFGSLFDDDDDY